MAFTGEDVVLRATSFYENSRDANGLPVRDLLQEGFPHDDLNRLIACEVAAGRLEVVFEEVDTNPHIRRLPRRLRKPFDELFEKCDLSRACLYPSPPLINERIDLSRFKDRPYNHRLWAGGSHLDLVFFDVHVLERYRNDPRYRFNQSFFGGAIWLKDKHFEDMPEKDHAFIQRFGVGYDSDGHWVIGVILSDLRDLSPQHERVWREYEREDPCKLNEASFASWFMGEWTEFGSIYEALAEEMKIINLMAKAIGSEALFKNGFEEYPKGYGILLRPTQKEFLDFARVLDLMLSENINPDFFPSWIAREKRVLREDGSETVHPVGTLGMLKEWIARSFRSNDDRDPARDVTDPLRKVRKLRSKASHADVSDEFDWRYQTRQQELLSDSYTGVRTLRLILSNHPKARSVTVPDWLFRGDIRWP